MASHAEQGVPFFHPSPRFHWARFHAGCIRILGYGIPLNVSFYYEFLPGEESIVINSYFLLFRALFLLVSSSFSNYYLLRIQDVLSIMLGWKRS